MNQSGAVMFPSDAVVLSVKLAVNANVPAPLPDDKRNDRVEKSAGLANVRVPLFDAVSSMSAFVPADGRSVYWVLGLAALVKVVPIGRPVVGAAVLKPVSYHVAPVRAVPPSIVAVMKVL